MKIGDSRSWDGPGILPLQDHMFESRKAPLDQRFSVLGMRVTGRRDGIGEIGQAEYGEGTAGDIQGFFFWEPAGRPIGTWREVVPSHVAPKPGDESPIADKPAGSGEVAGEIVENSREPFGAVLNSNLGGAPSGGGGGGGGGGSGAISGGGTVSVGVLPGGSGSKWKWPAWEGVPNPLGGSFPWPKFTGGGVASGGGDRNKGWTGGTDFEKIGGLPDGYKDGGDGASGAPGANGKEGGAGMAMPPETAQGLTGEPPDAEIRPTAGVKWRPDRRYAPLRASMPIIDDDYRAWPAMPKDAHGLTVASTDEGVQIEYFHPTDPRLFAPNRGGNPTHGTLVADVTDEDRVDISRMAPLQSAFRVVAKPEGDLCFESGRHGNILARNIGVSGLRATHGGLVADMGGRQTILGHESVRNGGPVDVAGMCKHRFAVDADGNPISPVHISNLAFFRDLKWDGPLHFEGNPYPEAVDLPFKVLTHLDYDEGLSYDWPRDGGAKVDQGKWRWWSSCAFGETTPGETVDDDDPPPPPETDGPTTPGGEVDPAPPAITPGGDAPTIGGGTNRPGAQTPGRRTLGNSGDGGNGGGGGGGGGGIEHTYTLTAGSGADQRARPMIFTYRDLALNALSGRPQLVRSGATDLAHSRRVDDAEVRDYDERAPVTWRAFTYGAQGGTAGDSVFAPTGSESPADRHEYTQEPRSSRSPSGTGNGGLVFTVPEAFPDDIDADLTPASGSTSYVIAAPGVRFGVGVPDLPTGGLRDGYSWEVNTSGELEFYAHDGTGTRSLVMTLTVSGNLSLADGVDIETGETTGTSIGASASDKVAFHGATPITQSGAISDPAGGTTIDAESRDAIGSILTVLRNTGLIAT